jgi:hypothetical protein
MSVEKEHFCSTCSFPLTPSELADNIYAGIEEINYVCYRCQIVDDEINDEIIENDEFIDWQDETDMLNY